MRPLRLVAMLIAAALVAAGCGSERPSPTDAPASAAPIRASAPPDPSVAAQEAAMGDWRRSPVRPTPEFAASAETACRTQAAVGALPLAVLDARGESRAILVFDDGATAVLCRAEVPPERDAIAQARGVDRPADVTPPPEASLGAWDQELVEGDLGAFTVLVGQVGDGVHSVAVSLDADRAWYGATMANGWYAIWWPGADAPLSVAANDMRSVAIDHLTP